MEFIITKNNKVVNLLDMDEKFCNYMGYRVDPDDYAIWYFYLGLACKNKGRFSDGCIDRKLSYLESKVIKDDDYSLTGEEVARILMLILFDDSIKYNSSIEEKLPMINFWLLPENKNLVIIFHF